MSRFHKMMRSTCMRLLQSRLSSHAYRSDRVSLFLSKLVDHLDAREIRSSTCKHAIGDKGTPAPLLQEELRIAA